MVAQLQLLAERAQPFHGYRLCRFLGKGGWGEVWKATRPDGKAVALKFLPCSSQQAAGREIRALQSVRQLQHPNLVRTLQVWADAGYVVIVMELAEGTLLDLLTISLGEVGSPLHPKDVCFFLGQVASVLDFLNTRQHWLNDRRVAVRHCDVKPTNLLVFGTTVKLADFSLSVQTTSTMWNYERVGTLDYAAPEVFQGWLSDRTDQFALAVTWYQLRTGQLPYADTPRRFDPRYVRPVPDLSPLLPDERPILTRALAPVPQDRWPSCGEFIERLRVLYA
jgi:serine/threonine protein kinase